MARVVDVFPRLATEIADTLRREGEHALADQIDTLDVVEMCDCGEDFCQSFYTAPVPDGAWGPGHRNLDPGPPWPGLLILDIVSDRITHIEIIDRPALD